MVKATNEQGKTAVFCEEEIRLISDAIITSMKNNNLAAEIMTQESLSYNYIMHANRVLKVLNEKILSLIEEDGKPC